MQYESTVSSFKGHAKADNDALGKNQTADKQPQEADNTHKTADKQSEESGGTDMAANETDNETDKHLVESSEPDKAVVSYCVDTGVPSDEQHGMNYTDYQNQKAKTEETLAQQVETNETCTKQHETIETSALDLNHQEVPDKKQVSTAMHDQAMTNLQAHAQAQQAKANLTITSLWARLRKRDMEVRNLREGHERQMAAVVAHLLRLEGEMQREQKQVIEALADRDDIIRRQKAAIDDLTEKNERLVNTLRESHMFQSSKGAPHQNGDISIRDHGNKVVIRGTKGRSSGRSIKSSGGEFKSVNGEKPKNRFTSAMMERLRRHKSSLELYRPEPLEPLIEGSLRYFSSQDNLVDDQGEGEGETDTSGATEAAGETPVRREGNLQRKQRCRSLVDYPFVGDLEEADEEVSGSTESCYEEGFSSSPSRISRHDSGLSSSMSSLTSSGETSSWVRRWSGEGGGKGGMNGGIHSRGKSAVDLSNPTSSPQSPSSPNCVSPPSRTPASPYGFSELSKSRSVPHALPTVSENDTSSATGGTGKERPHSLTSVEMLTRDLSRSNSVNSTSTPDLTPAGSANCVASSSPPSSSSESNPFKSFKNVFKRRGSKKKRSVSLSQHGNQEHSETVKQYFKKHDLP